ncbi:MAG: sulfatase-like hydrolase/transferase, partial [Lentimicrobiaceae bacterium]|nr:sulfatase-like hydrolase/transferase [Lentimicrobiaceae bacterium]
NDYFAAYNFRHEYNVGTAYYHLNDSEKIFYDKYEPDAQTDMAIEQIEKLSNDDKPFAFFLSYGTPHDPWVSENVPQDCLDRVKDLDFTLPPNYLDENDEHADAWAKFEPGEREELVEWMRCYYAMICNLDDNVGRLLSAIKENGIDDSTIIVFTSDHGEMFGAHGRRAKNIFYEEAVRVPFLVKWKNVIKENSKSDIVLNTVDIMPSLLSMLNLPIPEAVEGNDLSREICENESSNHVALLQGTGPTAIFGDGYEWRACRSNKYTYAVYKSDGMEFLFDNIADPFQMYNLINDTQYRDLKETMKQKMLRKMADIGDTFENNMYYKENWVQDRVIVSSATL